MARDSLRLLALYAAACGAAWFFLRWYQPQVAGALSTALLAVPLTMAAGYVVAARGHLQEERRVLGSARETVFRDGERVVVRGPITPLREPLKSPFTGRDCVAYRYVIDREERNVDGPPSRIRDYWGLALCPSAVETPSGPVRILGWPSLETLVDVMQDKARAEAYVRATTFRHPGTNAERLGSIADPQETESDQFRDDACADRSHDSAGWHRETPDFTGRDVSEWRVEVGQVVCATGTYTARLGALLPGGSGPSRLRLSTFTPELWASENRDTAYTYLLWGAAFAVLAVACALATRWC
jgi:hypothetical protein